MKLTQQPNFRVEDYQGAASWVGRIFVPLNQFIVNISQIFDKEINYDDNIKSITQTFSIQSFPTGGIGMGWSYPESPPKSVQIISAYKTTSQTPCSLICAWSYNASTTSITLSQVLEVSTSGNAQINGVYTFTVRATV